MQDAYGLFMEADKEARMSVLANILGLGIYEQLTDLAKAKVSELNKALAVSKAKLAELDEKLKGKPELVVALAEHEAGLAEIGEDIVAKETEIKVAEELLRTLMAKVEKSEDIESQIKVLKDEVFAKKIDIGTKRQSAERAQKILDNEAAIIAKSEEYERVKDQVLVLETKKPKFVELKNEESGLTNDLTALEMQQVGNLLPQIIELEKLLASKPELDMAAEEYRVSVVKLGEMDELAAKDADIFQQILTAKNNTNKIADEIRFKQSKLEELTRKTLMLSNANCIDPENAKCAFLADAQRAKAEISPLEQIIKNLQESQIPLVGLVKELDIKYTDLGYDATVHRDLRNAVNVLRPKAELAGQLDSKAELLNGLRIQMADIEKRKRELQGKKAEIYEAYVSLGTELSVLPQLAERLPKLKAWADSKNELPAARQIVLSTADVIKGIEADITSRENQIAKLDEEKMVIAYETMGLPTAEMNVNKFHADFKQLRNLQLDYTAKIGSLTSQLETLAKDEAERQQLNAEMAPTAKELVGYQTLTRAFGLDGIPFSIVRSVVPELSYTANDILGQMTSGKMALEIKPDKIQKSTKKEVNVLEVWLTDFRGSRPYGDYSGGEKVKAALANAFALADLKARRVGIMFGMMFIDEPPFLDSEGSEAYCDALEGLNVRNPNMRVIAMSHDFGMKARFPQQIEVVDMGDEGSKVRLID
jgi:exonuclease SbcC